MTQQNRPPEPQGEDWQTWGRRLMAYLSQTRIPLVQQTGNEPATDDGLLMWDREKKYPVVSKDGAWVQVVLEDGHYDGTVSTNQTAASANTAYALTFSPDISDGIANGTPASRIVVNEAGEYLVSFSAQIVSSSASTVTFWFWPRVNGVNVSKATMKNSLHNNGAVFITSRSALFELNAGDYIEAMWAVDSTDGSLQTAAATAFAPAAPAATVSIVRLHG